MNLTLFITGVYGFVVYKFLVYLRTSYYNDFLTPKGKGPVNFCDNNTGQYSFLFLVNSMSI